VHVNVENSKKAKQGRITDFQLASLARSPSDQAALTLFPSTFERALATAFPTLFVEGSNPATVYPLEDRESFNEVAS